MDTLHTILLVSGAVFILLLAMFAFFYGYLYVKALLAGEHVGAFEIISMKLMNVKPSVIVNNRIIAGKAGVGINPRLLEAHYLAGGDVTKTVGACIMAKEHDIPLTFDYLCGIDLDGGDARQSVQDLRNTGAAVTAIDPCGQAKFGNQHYDVAADGEENIDVGEEVRVTGVDNQLHLLVRRV